MKLVTWIDKHGYKHRSLVRDDDSDEMGPQGILQDPPNLEELDWEGIKLDLHNALVSAGLFTWRDVQEKRGLRGAILSAMKRRLVYLYREAEKND
jgi:predicted nuclease with TOPRIM domain